MKSLNIFIFLFITFLSFSHFDLHDPSHGTYFFKNEFSSFESIDFKVNKDIQLKEIIINNFQIDINQRLTFELYENSNIIFKTESTFNYEEIVKFDLDNQLFTNNSYTIIFKSNKNKLTADLFSSKNSYYTDYANIFTIDFTKNESQDLKKIPLLSIDGDFSQHYDITENNIKYDVEEINPFLERTLMIKLPNPSLFYKIDSLGLSYYETGKDNIGNIKFSLLNELNNKIIHSIDTTLINIHKSIIKVPFNVTLEPKNKYKLKIEVNNSTEKDGMVLAFKPLNDSIFSIENNLLLYKDYKNDIDSLFPFLVINGKIDDIEHINDSTQLINQSKIFNPVLKKHSLSFHLNSNFNEEEIIESIIIYDLEMNKINHKIEFNREKFKTKTKSLKSGIYILHLKTNFQVYKKTIII